MLAFSGRKDLLEGGRRTVRVELRGFGGDELDESPGQPLLRGPALAVGLLGQPALLTLLVGLPGLFGDTAGFGFGGELLLVESLRLLAEDRLGAAQLPDRAALDEALIGVEGTGFRLLLFRLAPSPACGLLLIGVVHHEPGRGVEVLVVEALPLLLGDDLPEPRFFGVERCDARGLGGGGGGEGDFWIGKRGGHDVAPGGNGE